MYIRHFSLTIHFKFIALFCTLFHYSLMIIFLTALNLHSRELEASIR